MPETTKYVFEIEDENVEVEFEEGFGFVTFRDLDFEPPIGVRFPLNVWPEFVEWIIRRCTNAAESPHVSVPNKERDNGINQ